MATPLSIAATATVQPATVSRNDLAKGYEVEQGKYVCVSQNELLVPIVTAQRAIARLTFPLVLQSFLLNKRSTSRPTTHAPSNGHPPKKCWQQNTQPELGADSRRYRLAGVNASSRSPCT